jgi:hypothetical protein
MSKKKELPKPVTASELMNQLDQDPNFVQRRKEIERHFEAVQIALQVAEEPIVNALRSVGIRVGSVWDLVNERYTEPRVIPILVEQLRLPYPYRIREGIARGLTVQNAGKKALRVLVDEFKKVPDSEDAPQHGFKWALGNAISVVADKSSFDEVVSLLRDKSHGTTRDMMVLRLPRLDHRLEAIAVLTELLSDEDVIPQALAALGTLEAVQARASIEVFKNSKNAVIRKAARDALRKIGPAKSAEL